MACLIICDHDNVALNAATLHVATAAAAIGGEVHALVAGKGCDAVAKAAAGISGVGKVLVCDDARYGHGLAENLAALVGSLAAPYSHILAANTTSGKNVVPRIAALLDCAQVSEIVKVESPDTFVRPIYAGNALAIVRSKDKVKLLTVRTTGFPAAATGAGPAPVEAVAAADDTGLAQFVGQELTRSERPELTGARVIVSGGRGMQSGDNFKLIEPIADRLGAAIGASRAAVDSGFVSNDFQVGQTGKVVAPELYIAVGISGAIQHLAGMKDSKVIVAINKDEDAPIFQVADYGLVADLFQALPALAAELERQGVKPR
jgi:electron transfer flavoprotein alpha subunit